MTNSTHSVTRNPRYRIVDPTNTWVNVERTTNRVPPALPALLVDFSRQGARLRAAVPLEAGEPVTLSFSPARGALDLVLHATVQWQRPAGNDTTAVGCRFVREVDWEAMGELFLCGILARDNPT